MDPIELADDGFVNVTLKGDGSEITQPVDLYEANNVLAELHKRFQGKPLAEYHAAIAEWLAKKGFPPVSHRVADKFATSIFDRVARLKNADAGEPTPGLPGSTASPSAA